MIKHVPGDLSVVFSEIPDEITLAFNISNCQNNCLGCHSPYLRHDIGEELTLDRIDTYIKKNSGITCICFMGEGNDLESLTGLARSIKSSWPYLSLAIYSGRTEIEDEFFEVFDYIKIGPYIEERGPLNDRNTNQILYKKFGESWENITYRFWGESFAEHERADYIINPEKEEMINKALKKKKEKYGEEYCPCVLPAKHSEKTICPCEEYRMTKNCRCGLYKY